MSADANDKNADLSTMAKIPKTFININNIATRMIELLYVNGSEHANMPHKRLNIIFNFYWIGQGSDSR